MYGVVPGLLFPVRKRGSARLIIILHGRYGYLSGTQSVVSHYLSLVEDPHIILTIGIYPFVKTYSGLSSYCHGNADFPNVWERCWPTHTMPIYKGAAASL